MSNRKHPKFFDKEEAEEFVSDKIRQPEQKKKFKETVDNWNKQRHSPFYATQVFNVSLVPGYDLEFYDFSNLELNGIDFSGDLLNCSVFYGTQLAYARFGETRLGGVDFERANLTAADFSFARCDSSGSRITEHNCADKSTRFAYARLDRAVFHHSVLKGVDFSNASLLNTKFVSSSLENANLENAVLGGTVFSNVDLSCVKGLDSIKHNAGSYLDFHTLALSGNLPLSFLRGCGLPDILIEYIPSLINNPIQFYSCFISYSSKNQIFADRLYADLQNKGVRCWLASEDLKIGAKTRIAIDESIRVHDKLLLVLSKHSIESDWVEQEVETALNRERKEKRTVLFPIRLDDTAMKIDTGWTALIRNTRNIGDFRKWRNPEDYQKAFDRLLRDLKAEEKKD